ncbi:PAS domain S-box protein [Thermoleptolyngbya sichuanensis A183]|uniref:histidine kinase n=1 Tax=Thermoleptolyngbya sichuanensis A183 TaxID=2737172 RepID=A0A6M8BCL2_9CYAN|nr:PAS domain S-box protein [Thermoleptolyngbya sichuanensis]QKD84438.1 PAS domain S-box protein [Thermoleptolyngbya sichuanensis A183]
MLSQPSDDFPHVDLSDNEVCRDKSLLPQPLISQAGGLRSRDRPALENEIEDETTALSYLRAFFEEVVDAMAIADDSGHYIDANPAACELFGVSLDDLLGRCIADFSQIEFDFPSAWQQFLEKGRERGEFTLVRPDGTVREVEYAATAHFVPHRHLSVLRDMTERRQLERQVQALNQDLEQQVQQRTADLLAANAMLQATNQRLQAEIRQRERAEIALECAEDGVWDWHIPTGTLWLSGAWKQMLGYDDRTDEIGDRLQEWSRRLHPDDRNRVLWETEIHLAGHTPLFRSEYRLRDKHGAWRWILDRGKVVERDATGAPLRMIGTHVDITERKHLEESLRESQQKYQTLFEILPVGVSITDAAGRVIEVNPASEKILGISAREHTRRTCDGTTWNVLHADGSPMPPDRYASVKALREGQTILGQEQGVRRPDGSVCWVSVSAAPIPLEHYGVAIAYVDISNRKAAEIALRQSELRLLEISNSSPANIYILVLRQDGSLYIEHMSRAIEEILEYSVAEVIANPNLLVECIHPDDRATYEAAVQRSLVGLEPFYCEWRVMTPSGQVKWLKGSSRPKQRDNGDVAWYGVVLDISDLKAAETALQRQAYQERMLSEVVRAIRSSLDLNTIFTISAAHIAEFLQGEVAIVQYLPAERCWRHLVVHNQLPNTPDKLAFDIPDTDNPFAEQLKRLQIVQIDNTTTIQDPINRRLAEVFPGAWLLVPISANGEVWGSLTLSRAGSEVAWQAEEKKLAKRVADQLAIAIQQSNLHQQVQRWAATLEQQVRERTAELQQALEFEAVLKRITDKVRDSLDERKILQAVVQELGQTLRVLCCDTALYDLEHRTSTIYCEYAAADQSAAGLVLPMEDHPQLYTQLLQGVGQQFCHRCLEVQVSRQLMHDSAILTQPIRDDQGSLGDIWLLRPREQWFSEPEIRLVQQVANQCAIALRQSRLYQAAQAQVTELQRLNRLKDDFLSTVSHELRTPMASIKLATDLLEVYLRQLGLLPEPGQSTPTLLSQYFQILEDEGQREISLINDLLDLTRLDADAEPLILSPLTLQDWLPHVLEPFWERAQRQQQQLTLSITPDLPPIVTDASLLQRVLRELLTNACKYTPTGEAIEVSATATATLLNLCVANTGVDVPATECDRIFDRFYRIPNLDPWKHGGTGLGLALVKKRVEYLGGMIWAECESRRLSLRIQLPLERSPQCQNPQALRENFQD